jgi:SpoVK/Ycf46/Vps4 family AAA+-type ATPase
VSIQQQLLLDLFERYHRRGMEAYRRGDNAVARRSLLQAAEALLKLATSSAGHLRKARAERADKLFELARSIEVGSSPEGSGRKRAAAEDDDNEAANWIVAETPDVSLDDVAGLDDVKAAIRKRVIHPFEHPEITARYKKRSGGGVLLYGPPGTGKTMLAKAVASEIDATFFSIRCSDIMSKWVGQAEGNIKKLFAEAAEHERAVIFFDETEAIVAKRGGHSTVMNRVIPEFLAQVDGVSGRHGGLLLLGATNRPWDMDEAALRPGRFDELIYVPLPDAYARKKIISDSLVGVPLAADIDVDQLAEAAAGYSGADCVAFCEAAKDGPYEREIATGSLQCIEPGDFEYAARQTRKSVSKKSLARYEAFEQNT